MYGQSTYVVLINAIPTWFQIRKTSQYPKTKISYNAMHLSLPHSAPYHNPASHGTTSHSTASHNPAITVVAVQQTMLTYPVGGSKVPLGSCRVISGQGFPGTS